ncbi:hypothetical protein FK535_25920 [Mycolicibacterium sp. 018/SC-01/001]|uniref:hypothetical protein n=1 Tax=Mycolicibacterium sp. 018/SC-01/001 TaxID=2592069 RepID=UPI00117D67C7|nr:hypothetical protein [Mycolicibacterium sp. 018/SC-01/001]TRW78199.1 hypothetical protein FK535_25920 [Mycolicibacterium sp. 018/SC-01/001]
MPITTPSDLATGARAVRDTAGAAVGRVRDLFRSGGDFFVATLTIDEDAETPAVEVLRPGATHAAVVQVGPDDPASVARKLCIRLPDVYGAGKSQDFLLASSGDGAPMHHAVLPADPVAPLYSSLWLYLAGMSPVAFGARPETTGPDARFAVGSEIDFMISGPIGRFRRIGTLTLTAPHDETVRFSGSNSGGGIRPLPPVAMY